MRFVINNVVFFYLFFYGVFKFIWSELLFKIYVCMFIGFFNILSF